LDEVFGTVVEGLEVVIKLCAANEVIIHRG